MSAKPPIEINEENFRSYLTELRNPELNSFLQSKAREIDFDGNLSNSNKAIIDYLTVLGIDAKTLNMAEKLKLASSFQTAHKKIISTMNPDRDVVEQTQSFFSEITKLGKEKTSTRAEALDSLRAASSAAGPRRFEEKESSRVSSKGRGV